MYIRTQLVMPHDTGLREKRLQFAQYPAQRFPLLRRTRIRWFARLVQPALITDGDTVQVVLFNPIYVSCYYNQ